MRRIAELPTPLRYLVYAFLVLALWFVLRWVDREDPPATVEIHVKYRHAPAHPMFHVAHAASDARAHWGRIFVRNADVALAELRRDPDVVEAFVAPAISLPSEQPAADDPSCPIATPSFESYQGYLGPAPHGIDAPAAWRRGIRGQGEWFADIEGGWNRTHEDLPGERITHVGGDFIESWRPHGTAVLGEVVGRDNGKGVVGIAPDVDRVFTSSIGNTTVADAIDTAAEQLRAGDVLLIELQGFGPRGRFVPIEYWDDNYDAIAAATARGVVIVEAAGNGGEDLDHAIYDGVLSRDHRDSGAIVVGAGGPPRDGFTDRERLDFSNYGSRVDVQGWGRMVATLDYGDLQKCSGIDRHYTNLFSGTSSASPIVAGAAVLVESAARARGRVLTPAQVRELLRATGTAQTGDADREPIGPRPDLARAFAALPE